MPLIMVYIGLLIVEYSKKEMQTTIKHVTIPLLVKLLLFPCVTFFILKLFPLNIVTKEIIIVLVAMPTTIMAPFIVASNVDYVKSSSVVVMYCTVCSLVTIPFISYVVSFFYKYIS